MTGFPSSANHFELRRQSIAPDTIVLQNLSLFTVVA